MTQACRGLSDDIHLVACAAQKRDVPTRAADLYSSDWFAKARTYVEATGTRWYILSAAHGLVKPFERLAPYDACLSSMSAPERLVWAQRVINQLRCKIDPRHTGRIVLLAGTHYREHLMAFAGKRAVAPMAGLGIGQQKAWLLRETRLLCPRREPMTDHLTTTPDDDVRRADGMRVSPWTDLAEWHGELDRQDTIMAPRRKLYRRFEAKAAQLTTQRIQNCRDTAAIDRLVPRLLAARYPNGGLHGLEHVWQRDVLGTLIVEATNRRTLMALGRNEPHAKGPRLDPARIPDNRLDHLIQTHRDIAVVEQLRCERQRRALAVQQPRKDNRHGLQNDQEPNQEAR